MPSGTEGNPRNYEIVNRNARRKFGILYLLRSLMMYAKINQSVFSPKKLSVNVSLLNVRKRWKTPPVFFRNLLELETANV